jgi:outer membrane receptor for ferrienterochelin and colicins
MLNNSIKTNTFIMFALCCGIFIDKVHAQNCSAPSSIEMLSKLSLEQLMQVEIETVSKNTEDLYSAAGIVTLISAEEIRRFGGNILYDILDRATSIIMGGSILYPRNNAVMRGDQVNGLDRHILILINGRPSRDSLAGGINYPIYNAFPLSVIERLEIIRGPGSVLYGTNAFTGVINIITKDKSSNNCEEQEITLTGGSHGAKSLDGYGTFSNNRLHLVAGLKYFKDEGWDFSALDANRKQGTTQMGQENIGTTLTGHYQNFHFNLIWVKSTENYLGTDLNWNNEKFAAMRNRLLANMGYNWKINDTQRVTANATYNLSQGHAITKNNLSSEGSFENGVLELNHYLDFAQFSWLSGINIDHSRDKYIRYWLPTRPLIDPAPQPPYNDTIYMMYSQLDYKPNAQTQLTVGGQVVKNPKQDWKFIPRLGLVHRFNSNWGGKLLFSEAYRAASQVERNINLPVVRGNPLLSPETVQTLDAQIFYQHDKHQTSLTYFNSLQKDLIVRYAVPNSLAHQHSNQGELKVQGLELETRFSPSDHWFLTGSLTYQQNKNNAGQQDFTLAPNWLAKAGISYKFSSGTTVSLFDIYVGASADSRIRNLLNLMVNPNPSAYHLATLNISHPIGKMLGLEASQKMLLNAYVYNLFNEDIYAPEINSLNINSVPAKAGRSAYLGLQYQF